MMESGCFCACYSPWFNTAVPEARYICCEPDPDKIAVGQRNAQLNAAPLQFVAGAAGRVHSTPITFSTERRRRDVQVPVFTSDGLLAESGWDRLDVSHIDFQGAELAARFGALETTRPGGLRFVIVSTHHRAISGNADIRGDCLRLLTSNEARIISSHTVAESFTRDGLIVASFAMVDTDFTVAKSLNETDQSLFRPSEEDLAIILRTFR